MLRLAALLRPHAPQPSACDTLFEEAKGLDQYYAYQTFADQCGTHRFAGLADAYLARQCTAPPAPATSDSTVQLSTSSRHTGSVSTQSKLSELEIETFKSAVVQCWQIGVGSEAARATVVLKMSFAESGKIKPGSIQMSDGHGGDPKALEVAFQAARRAIIRCQGAGYDLPPGKYDQWRDVELTFDPTISLKTSR